MASPTIAPGHETRRSAVDQLTSQDRPNRSIVLVIRMPSEKQGRESFVVEIHDETRPDEYVWPPAATDGIRDEPALPVYASAPTDSEDQPPHRRRRGDVDRSVWAAPVPLGPRTHSSLGSRRISWGRLVVVAAVAAVGLLVTMTLRSPRRASESAPPVAAAARPAESDTLSALEPESTVADGSPSSSATTAPWILMDGENAPHFTPETCPGGMPAPLPDTAPAIKVADAYHGVGVAVGG
jgi:hypothetical protein